MRIEGLLRGQLRFNEPLAKYTSWRVGGPAKRFYSPADKSDLEQFIQTLAIDDPVFFLGLGSNVLIRDAGVSGTVIYTRGKLKQMYKQGSEQLYVESGVPCAHVARFCTEQGLAGAEFLAGIPGTIGGALKMNAGAFGGETWDLVNSVEMLTVGGVAKHYSADEFSVGYRSVNIGDKGYFLSAVLQLNADSKAGSQNKIKELLGQRAATQPTHQATCGSVFKNPSHDYAARLIELSGLKGYIIGGAQVSQKHANFIVNTGEASALDIESLIEFVQNRVYQLQGIQLQTEVCIVGDKVK